MKFAADHGTAKKLRLACRSSIALVLLAATGLLNSCGGGGSEPASGGAAGAATCAKGSAATSLMWDAVSGATGYRVYWGTTSGSYPQSLDVGNSTTANVPGLVSGTTYYFVATDYDSSTPSLESSFSNEVCKTIS